MSGYNDKSSERFKVLYDVSQIPIIVMDEAFIIVYINAAAEALFSAAPGDSMTDIMSTLSYARIRERVKAGVTRFSFIETRRLSAMLADFTLTLDEDNRECIVCKVIEYPSDFTASLTNYVLSHDFRMPISVISSTADLLRKSPNLSEKEQVFSEIILNNCHRLLRILRNISHSVEQMSPPVSPEKPACDLSAMLEQMLGEAAVISERGGVSVTHGGIPPRMIVACDYSRLECALLNLLSNAIKYGGKNVHFTARVAADMAEITVSDDGAGISPSHTARIFDPFYSIGGDSPYPGMGLGLYIVKMLASDCGGAIRVESQPGRGSTFTLTLPLSGDAGSLRAPSTVYGADSYSPVALELATLFSPVAPGRQG